MINVVVLNLANLVLSLIGSFLCYKIFVFLKLFKISKRKAICFTVFSGLICLIISLIANENMITIKLLWRGVEQLIRFFFLGLTTYLLFLVIDLIKHPQ